MKAWVCVFITKQLTPSPHTYTHFSQRAWPCARWCDWLCLVTFPTGQSGEVLTQAGAQSVVFGLCFGSKARPAGDWVIGWAGLFSRCQLAHRHLLTFKRQQWQQDQHVLKHDTRTHTFVRISIEPMHSPALNPNPSHITLSKISNNPQVKIYSLLKFPLSIQLVDF